MKAKQRITAAMNNSRSPDSVRKIDGDSAQPTLDSRYRKSDRVAFERVLNTEEAAALLQIHPKTLQRMARQGSVPAFRIGDLWRFRATELDLWLRSAISSTPPLVSSKS